MSNIKRALLSLVVVTLMLTVSLTPLANTQEVYASDDDNDDDGKDPWLKPIKDEDKPWMNKNTNGTYTFHFPYLEKRLSIKSSDAPYGDPSHGTIDIRPMEVHYYDGHPGSGTNKMVKQDGTSVDYEIGMSGGINRCVEFGLRYTDHAVETGQEDLMEYGINASSPQNLFFLQGAGGANKVTLGPDTEYRQYVLDNYRCISPMQSMNLLPFAVGNFTGDDSEEIALFMGNGIDFYDYGDNANDGTDGKVSYNYLTMPIDRDPYGHGYKLNPVSMTAGDIDGDGADELVVAVEYSEAVGNAFDVANGAHMTYIYVMDPQSNTLRASHLYFEHGNDTHGYTECLDSVMTSVYLQDLDHDGICELIVGGYMWDNVKLKDYETANGHGSYFNITMVPSYYTGEMYLGLLDMDSIGSATVAPYNLSRLMDDPQGGTDLRASNGPLGEYRGVEGEYDHRNGGDTSIFLDDGSENDFGYCRSNNWMNWTIPLIGLNINGEGRTCGVYFDACMYYATTDGFSHYSDVNQGVGGTSDFRGHNQDNNNACLIRLDKGCVHPRGNDACLGYEDLFRFIAVDQRPYDSGYKYASATDVLWYWDVHYMNYLDSDGSIMDTPQFIREECSDDYNVTTEWEQETDPVLCCPVDYDPKDTMWAKYLTTVSTVTDPVVLAAMSAIPYDDDLALMMLHGNNDIGETSFNISFSNGVGTGSSATLSLDMGGSLEAAFLSASASAGWFEEIDHSHSMEYTFDVNFGTSTDSVALYLTPYYSYTYRVFSIGDDDKPVMNIQNITQPLTPVFVILDKQDYRIFIHQYNKMMDEYAGQFDMAFTPVKDITEEAYAPFSDHTEGDLSSYVHKDAANNPLPLSDYAKGTVLVHDVGTAFAGLKDAGSTTNTMTFEECDEDTTTGGAMMNAEVSAGCMVKADFGMDFETSSSSSTSTNKGIAFSAEMSNGVEASYYDEYPYNENEPRETLSQYSNEGTFWTVMKTVYLDNLGPDPIAQGDDQRPQFHYMYLGYTVTGYSNGPKIGEIHTDAYIPSQEGMPDIDFYDPLNPKYDKTYVKIVVPGDVRPDQLADYYSLEIAHEKKGWYDVSSTVWSYEKNGEKHDVMLELRQVVFDDNGKVKVDEDGNVQTEPAGTSEPGKHKVKFIPDQGVDQTIWLEVSNLNEYVKHFCSGGHDYEFRLTGFRDASKTTDDDVQMDVGLSKMNSTSTRPEPGYSLEYDENVETIVNSDFKAGEGFIHIFPNHLAEGRNIIIQTVDLEPGSTVDVTVFDPESDREFFFDDVRVYSDGLIRISLDNDAVRGDVEPAITIVVFLGILACLGAGWYVLRKD